MIDNLRIFTITQHVLYCKQKKHDVFEIFNNWIAKYNIDNLDYEEALWFIEYIKLLMPLNEELLENALSYDTAN